jgi:sialic acid synthase SpsE
MRRAIDLGGRIIGGDAPPLVIAEIGINHDGVFERAVTMIEAAHVAGCECVKFQSHVVEDEMIYNEVVPGNASETIWNMMCRCALTAEQERCLKELTEEKGMLFLSTPFSRAAADRLQSMGVSAFKIGSGECNNTPLIEHIAKFGKPVILSTGMNDMNTLVRSVDILERYQVHYALLHCTSMYPTPYECVRLGAMQELMGRFPDVPVGLSDHSLGNYTCFGATALGACVLEKHFTADPSWPGADIPISITPDGLVDLIQGARAIHQALGGHKNVLAGEQPCIDFAYSCVVTIKPVARGEIFSKNNIWVKRPGGGEILASEYPHILGCQASMDIPDGTQLKYSQVIS